MCDLCYVLLPGVTKVPTRRGPFKHQEGWTSILDPISPASEMHRQDRCIRKVNAATQALWKSIWKIFQQIQKQVSTQNFLICSPQPLRLERGLQWLSGLLPSLSAAAQEMWPLSRISRAQTHAGALTAQPICCSHQGRAKASQAPLLPWERSRGWEHPEQPHNTHWCLIFQTLLCQERTKHVKSPTPTGWVTCGSASGIWLILSWSSKVSCQTLETMPGIYTSYRFVGQPSYRIILQETIQQQFPANAARTSLLCSWAEFLQKKTTFCYTIRLKLFFLFLVKCKSFVYVYALSKKKASLKSVTRQENITLSEPGKRCPKAHRSCFSMASSLKCFSELSVWLSPLLSLGSMSSIFTVLTMKCCVDQVISRGH